MAVYKFNNTTSQAYMDSIFTGFQDRDLIIVYSETSAITLNLPDAAVKKNFEIHIKCPNASLNEVTLIPILSQTIDEESSVIISFDNTNLSIMSDGDNWHII